MSILDIFTDYLYRLAGTNTDYLCRPAVKILDFTDYSKFVEFGKGVPLQMGPDCGYYFTDAAIQVHGNFTDYCVLPIFYRLVHSVQARRSRV